MTKSVRIENADTNDSKEIVVEVYEKASGSGPVLVNTIVLGFASHMETIMVSSSRYLVVTERDKAK